MNVTERLKLISIIDKINLNIEFSKKLGIRDASKYKYRKEKI